MARLKPTGLGAIVRAGEANLAQRIEKASSRHKQAEGSDRRPVRPAPDASHIDLLVFGEDNRIYSTHWDSGVRGRRTGSSSSTANAWPGSQIAASARPSERLDIFVVGGDSKINTAGWDGASGWSRWFAVGVT